MYQELALQIAKKAHAGQVDKAGNDYILHPMTVASYMDTDTEKAVAYLHDVLEDTNITVEQLRNQFPKEIVDTVIILTRKKNENYQDYICRVAKCRLAKKVKVADLLHNLDITRIKEPTERDFKRLEKYKKAVLYLAMHA
ncbi:HD domain-containing protein [Holdemanella biformis]|uniref:HD domain-containing protein n=1 Tax=Holdemanella biformis TaxID=1735 RepID=UPI001C26EC5E|nr:HD domain-containing protein [Holdemanella biformis]MBU9896034.1 HD domain-containing protein [Holdemanella biformis]MBV3417105.1 HD domain-containing protein [Holdemanella biformis]